MTNKIYDILKFIAQIVLPGLGTLYFALAGIWGLPYGEQVVGTITAIDTFLGLLLGLSSNNYYKNGLDTDGVLMVDDSQEEQKWFFEMNPEKTVEDITGQKTITLQVKTGAAISEEDDTIIYQGKH